MEQHGQDKKPAGPATVRELVIPNPKLKLLDQVREVLRIKHYAIRTEQAYCEWIRRYIIKGSVYETVMLSLGPLLSLTSPSGECGGLQRRI